MPKQNASDPDGKTFSATPATPSTQFGAFAAEEASQAGSDPGSKQVPAPVFNPAVPE